MAFEAKYVSAGDVVDYTPSAAVAAGEVIVQGNLVGIAKVAIAANTLGSLAVEGIFTVAKAAVEITVGALLYWDESANAFTTTDDTGANKFAGQATTAAASGDATVQIRMSQ